MNKEKECSACGKEDPTVDRNMFDGMCARCTEHALHSDSLARRAEKRNRELKRECGMYE